MNRDFFDPSPNGIDIVLVDEQMLAQATLLIVSCEACSPQDTEFEFDWVVNYMTGRRGSRTAYVLESPAKCPNCGQGILEKTLVRLG